MAWFKPKFPLSALRTLSLGLLLLGAAVGDASALTLKAWQINNIPATVTGSGNGTIDWRMFTFSGGEIKNTTTGGDNFDNANNTLPQGSGADTMFFAESFVTSGADLQRFYTLNFGVSQAGQIEIVLYLDLNETGGGMPVNTLNHLNIVLNPTIPSLTTSPYNGDVTGVQQTAINQVYSGGQELVNLYTEPFDNLPVLEQGAGWADYAVQTKIDPFALNASDILLFNISMSTLNNGAEEWFLSGGFASYDFPPNFFTPEPATGLLVGAGLAGLFFLRRKKSAA